MRVSLSQAAKILGKSDDEVMFLVQQDRLQSFIIEDEVNIDWEFELDNVLRLKSEIDEGLDGTLRRLLEE